MTFKVTQNSFAGGEVSPELYSRQDFSKLPISAKTIKNGFVKDKGCVLNRAGLEFVCETKNSGVARLIPFSFNTEQTYVIEAGDEYFRFIMDGGQIVTDSNTLDAVEIATPYQLVDLFMLKYAQTADILRITNAEYPVYELSRLSHYDWDLDAVSFSADITPPTDLAGEWSKGAGEADNFYYDYLITSIAEDTYEESIRSDVASIKGDYMENWEVDEYIDLTWTEVSGATEYKIYKNSNGIYGYIGTAIGGTFRDDKIEPDLTKTAPIYKNPFSGAGKYPACCNFHQQRFITANSNDEPQSSWSTQTGTYKNFNISRPLNASDAVSFTIAEREVNEIRHIVSLNDLIFLTSGGEWKISGTDGAFSATASLAAKPQSFYGCNNVAPIVSGNMILFIQDGGSIVRDLGYTYLSDSYDGKELTIFASHLFENKQIVDWAYSKEPNRIIWAVMSDGTLNSLTYNPQQEVMGWTQHDTDGYFESVAVVREGYEDVPYFVVKRVINGVTKRFIERMSSRFVDDAKDGFFVDCGLRYDGAPTLTVSGLDHLNGEEVIILADGGVIEGKTVAGGSITLDTEASKIIVGLPYTFELETLSFEGENTLGKTRSINNVSMKIDKSRPDFFVTGADGVDYAIPRTLESINDAGLLFNEKVETAVVSMPDEEATVKIKQKYPLPLTILSITAEITM